MDSSNSSKILYWISRSDVIHHWCRCSNQNTEDSRSNIKTDSLSKIDFLDSRTHSQFNNDQLLIILIPVIIVLALLLIFLIVALINPKLALCIRPFHKSRKKDLSVMGLMHRRRSSTSVRYGRRAINNNYMMNATSNGIRPASIPISAVATITSFVNSNERADRNVTNPAVGRSRINYARPENENSEINYAAVTMG